MKQGCSHSPDFEAKCCNWYTLTNPGDHPLWTSVALACMGDQRDQLSTEWNCTVSDLCSSRWLPLWATAPCFGSRIRSHCHRPRRGLENVCLGGRISLRALWELWNEPLSLCRGPLFGTLFCFGGAWWGLKQALVQSASPRSCEGTQWALVMETGVVAPLRGAVVTTCFCSIQGLWNALSSVLCVWLKPCRGWRHCLLICCHNFTVPWIAAARGGKPVFRVLRRLLCCTCCWGMAFLFPDTVVLQPTCTRIKHLCFGSFCIIHTSVFSNVRGFCRFFVCVIVFYWHSCVISYVMLFSQLPVFTSA